MSEKEEEFKKQIVKVLSDAKEIRQDTVRIIRTVMEEHDAVEEHIYSYWYTKFQRAIEACIKQIDKEGDKCVSKDEK